MPRIARSVVPNVPYHITQRGNHQLDVFYSTDNRLRYLKWFTQYATKNKLDVITYCLMDNHVHFVAIPRKSESMSRTIQTVHMRHTQAINREMKWSGHLWHSRYFSTALDEKYFVQAMRYVEQNPVRAGLVRKAEDYTWSSAAFHCGLVDKSEILYVGNEYESIFDDWKSFLAEVPDKEVIEILRRRTMSGVPCGNEKFIRKIAKRIGREIVERPRGGQRKPV